MLSMTNAEQLVHAFMTSRLLLKDEAVPTLKADAAVYGPQPVSIFYFFFIKLYSFWDVNKDQRGLALLAS